MNFELAIAIGLALGFGLVIGFVISNEFWPVVYTTNSEESCEPCLQESCNCKQVMRNVLRIIPDLFSYGTTITCRNKGDARKINEYPVSVSIGRNINTHDMDDEIYVGHDSVDANVDSKILQETLSMCGMEPFEISYKKDIIYNNHVIESAFEKCIIYVQMPGGYYVGDVETEYEYIELAIAGEVGRCMVGHGTTVEVVKPPESPEFPFYDPWKNFPIYEPWPIDSYPYPIWIGADWTKWKSINYTTSYNTTSYNNQKFRVTIGAIG